MKNKEQSRRLIEFRKSLGMTATEVSNKCSVSSGVWSQYESGRIEIHLQSFLRMKESANKYGIDLDEYLFCSEQKKELEINQITYLLVYSLKELREQLNLSQEIIATHCEVSHRTWGRYEREETDMLISTFIKIREYARINGLELVIEKKAPLVILANECYKKPSLRLCLQV